MMLLPVPFVVSSPLYFLPSRQMRGMNLYFKRPPHQVCGRIEQTFELLMRFVRNSATAFIASTTIIAAILLLNLSFYSYWFGLGICQNPRFAMSSPPSLSLHYSLPNGTPIPPTTIDTYELHASRRALKTLKTLFSNTAMLSLLAPLISEADTYYKSIIAASNNEYKESRIDLKATGLKVSHFMAWWKDWMADLQNPDIKEKTFLETMVPAHPEHYALPPYASGVVETIGGYIARVRIEPVLEPPGFVSAYGDPEFLPLSAIGTLDDGGVLFYILQELRDCDEGCEFRLRLLFPAAAPQVFFDEHAEHLAVEFRSFVTQAFERQQRLSGGEN